MTYMQRFFPAVIQKFLQKTLKRIFGKLIQTFFYAFFFFGLIFRVPSEDSHIFFSARVISRSFFKYSPRRSLRNFSRDYCRYCFRDFCPGIPFQESRKRYVNKFLHDSFNNSSNNFLYHFWKKIRIKSQEAYMTQFLQEYI